MTTPHEAVAQAISENVYEYYDHRTITAETTATAAIEALRSGAVERVRDLKYGSMRMGVEPLPEQLIEAILGPPNEVPE